LDDAKPTKKKTELPAILTLSDASLESSAFERKKFQPFKPPVVDDFHKKTDSEPRVGLCADKREKSIEIIHESMPRVKIIKTPRSRR